MVNTCGEIGLCTPCTEAHPPWRVCPPRAVRGGRGRTGGVILYFIVYIIVLCRRWGGC